MSDELSELKAHASPPMTYAHGIQEGGVPKGLFSAIQDVPIHVRGRYDRYAQRAGPTV